MPAARPFETQLQVRPAGLPVTVTRGWTKTEAQVGTQRFRFVNTHPEAFDNQASNGRNNGPDVGNGEIRQAQAQELVESGGPATGRRKVILLGDLNSDVATEVKPGDALAYQAVLNAGFVPRGPSQPFSCCLKTSDMRVTGPGTLADFDHNVDHILTDAPTRVRRTRGAVTGLAPVNGFWSADHAGVFASLRVR